MQVRKEGGGYGWWGWWGRRQRQWQEQPWRCLPLLLLVLPMLLVPLPLLLPLLLSVLPAAAASHCKGPSDVLLLLLL
jgi:hypothetical protein